MKAGTKPLKSRRKSTPARREAEGEACLVRVPGHCNGRTDTTVLAHYRLDTGGGQKPDDEQGAHACSACHDVVDFRVKAPEFTRDTIRLMHAEGCLRTQQLRRDRLNGA
ncbi:MAG: nuclease domain-containing protein [Pseudomonadota bacterium]